MPGGRKFTEVVVTRGRLCGDVRERSPRVHVHMQYAGRSGGGSLSCTHCVFHEIRMRVIDRHWTGAAAMDGGRRPPQKVVRACRRGYSTVGLG